jgi:hypothetical protein
MGGGDTANRLTKANRLSVRAVVVPHGRKAAKALMENGIYDPVAIPLTFAEELSAGGASSGGGWDPALIATLEPDDTGSLASTSELSRPVSAFPEDADRATPRPTATPSGEFGTFSLAPVRKRSD